MAFSRHLLIIFLCHLGIGAVEIRNDDEEELGTNEITGPNPLVSQDSTVFHLKNPGEGL